VSTAPQLGTRGKVAMALSLTTVGGFVDAVGYIALFEVWTANMSGNSIHLGMYLSQRSWMDLLRPLCAVAAYVTGMLLTRIAIEIAGRSGIQRIASFTLAAEAVLLLFFARATPEMHFGQIADRHAPAYFLLTGLLAFAMGVQTATLTHVGALTIYTTFVTGTLTKMTESVTRALFWFYDQLRGASFFEVLRSASAQQDAQDVAMLAATWLVYVLGATTGTLAKSHWELRSLYIPVIVLVALILLDRIRPTVVEEEKHQIGKKPA
jgi:uncharacterized membrane protein YoaK (UPF0700 family)